MKKHGRKGGISPGSSSPIQSYLYEKRAFDRRPDNIEDIGFTQQDRMIFGFDDPKQDLTDAEKYYEYEVNDIARLFRSSSPHHYHEAIDRLKNLVHVHGDNKISQMFHELQEEGRKASNVNSSNSENEDDKPEIVAVKGGYLKIKLGIVASVIFSSVGAIHAYVQNYGTQAIKEMEMSKNIEQNRNGLAALVQSIAKMQQEIVSLDKGLTAYQEEASRLSASQGKIAKEQEELRLLLESMKRK